MPPPLPSFSFFHPHTFVSSNLQRLWAAYKYSSWQSILFSCFLCFCPVTFFYCCFLFSFHHFNLHCCSDSLCRVASVSAALVLSVVLKLTVPPSGEKERHNMNHQNAFNTIKSKGWQDFIGVDVLYCCRAKGNFYINISSLQIYLEYSKLWLLLKE